MKAWKRFLIFIGVAVVAALLGAACAGGDSAGNPIGLNELERVTQTLVAPP